MKTLMAKIFDESKTRYTTNLDSVDVIFRRITDRYATKGTFSSNKGYLKVSRNPETGRFVSPSNTL